MRNVLKICTVMALAIVLVLGMFASAFAASSPTEIVEFWDDTEKVSLTWDFYSEGVPELTAEKAAELAGVDGELSAFWLGDVWGDTMDLECRIQGGEGTYYIFHFNEKEQLAKAEAATVEGEWEFIQSGEGDKFDVTFKSLSPVAVFQAVIPQTGDNSNMYLWGGLMIVAAAAAIGTVVYSKKRKNEA